METGDSYLRGLAQQLGAYRGKPVPYNLVEEWRHLDAIQQDHVRELLRSEFATKDAPAKVDSIDRDRPQTKQDQLVELLKAKGPMSARELARRLSVSPITVYNRVCIINKEAKYRIVSVPLPEGGRKYRLEGTQTSLFTETKAGPLTRSERGHLGGRAARGGSRRPQGTADKAYIDALEAAGDEGITAEKWAADLGVTIGGLYRRITELRRRQYSIENRSIPGDRRIRYVWGGAPSNQMDLQSPPTPTPDSPPEAPIEEPRKLLSSDAVTDLFGVSGTPRALDLFRSLLKANVKPTDGMWPEADIEPLYYKHLEGEFFQDSVARKGKPCRGCGTMFLGISRRKFCTAQCRQQFHNAKYVERRSHERQARHPGPDTRPDVDALRGITARLAELQYEMQNIKQLVTGSKSREQDSLIDALQTVDVYLRPGSDAQAALNMIARMHDEDLRVTRDWLSKLTGKLKRLVSLANELLMN